MKIFGVLDFIIYWSIIIMPFAVVISPAIANTLIGLFSGAFLISKLLKKEAICVNKTILISFICLIAIALLSFVNSVSYSSSIQGIVKLLKSLLIFIVCNEAVRDKRHLKKIIFSICCGVTLVSIDALWQYFFGFDFIHKIALHHDYNNLLRASASFPNPNLLGVYLAALIPLIAGLTIFYFKGKEKWGMFFLSILALIGLFLTLSRGAGLAVYLAILFLSIVGRKKFLILGLVAMLIIFPFVMPKNILKWAQEVNYNPVVFMLSKDRISIYSNAINMIRHHPFVGVGVNTFSKNYGKYKTESAERYVHTPDTIYAHNIYLHMAGEIGLFGFIVFLIFLFLIFKQVFNCYFNFKDQYLRAVSLSLIACLFAFLINGLTETSLYNSRVAMIFWFLIGISLCLSRLGKNSQENS